MKSYLDFGRIGYVKEMFITNCGIVYHGNYVELHYYV